MGAGGEAPGLLGLRHGRARDKQLVSRHPVLLREWGVPGALRWEHDP